MWHFNPAFQTVIYDFGMTEPTCEWGVFWEDSIPPVVHRQHVAAWMTGLTAWWAGAAAVFGEDWTFQHLGYPFSTEAWHVSLVIHTITACTSKKVYQAAYKAVEIHEAGADWVFLKHLGDLVYLPPCEVGEVDYLRTQEVLINLIIRMVREEGIDGVGATIKTLSRIKGFIPRQWFLGLLKVAAYPDSLFTEIEFGLVKSLGVADILERVTKNLGLDGTADNGRRRRRIFRRIREIERSPFCAERFEWCFGNKWQAIILAFFATILTDRSWLHLWNLFQVPEIEQTTSVVEAGLGALVAQKAKTGKWKRKIEKAEKELGKLNFYIHVYRFTVMGYKRPLLAATNPIRNLVRSITTDLSDGVIAAFAEMGRRRPEWLPTILPYIDEYKEYIGTTAVPDNTISVVHPLNPQVGYIARFVPKDDWLTHLWRAGKETGCCQKMGGAGERAAILSWLGKDRMLVVVEKADVKDGKFMNRRIVGQAYTHKYKGKVYLDSIETKPSLDDREGHLVAGLVRAVAALAGKVAGVGAGSGNWLVSAEPGWLKPRPTFTELKKWVKVAYTDMAEIVLTRDDTWRQIIELEGSIWWDEVTNLEESMKDGEVTDWFLVLDKGRPFGYVVMEGDYISDVSLKDTFGPKAKVEGLVQILAWLKAYAAREGYKSLVADARLKTTIRLLQKRAKDFGIIVEYGDVDPDLYDEGDGAQEIRISFE